MKHIFSSLLLTLLLISCGSSTEKSVEDIISEGNLATLKEKKAALNEKNKSLEAEIKLLDVAISKLDTEKKLELITTFIVKDSLFNHYIELQGSVDTKQNISVFAEFNGLLYSVPVKEGQRVYKGQVLGRIDDGGLSQQLAQMQVQSDLAKTTFERQKRLWEQKIGSEIQYLQYKSNYEAQEKAIAQMKNQLSKTVVTAPFNGVVDEIFTDQGTIVSAGTAVARIVNLNDMFIEAEVPETYLTTVKKATNVKVDFPVLNESLETKIKQVSSFINPSNRSFKIEVSVPNKSGNIKPNLTAKLLINDYTNENAILIPQNIISENAEGEQYVYTILQKEGENIPVTKKNLIVTGKTQGDYVEVLEGLKTGDEIILEGARSVKEGQEVAIKQN
ncbi:efflux RND transporter periplasmic adaptor subunit [Ascidiimonas sp. W6]|uniref:efflux RND transporter periplasmic adaptor subunit n=1 Tax=Ascidiimonas meishanensis TaxID=3128903 RepID=UPI0030EB9242